MINKINDFEMNVNEWGSCQYAGALHIYKLFLEQLKNNKNNISKTLNEFNIKDFYPSNINSIDRIKGEVLFYFTSDKNYTEDELVEKIKNIIKIEKVDDIFKIFRESSHDLWTATDTIFYFVFQDNLFFIIEDFINIKTEGPILNKIAQSQNYITGIKCALLKYLNVIEDDKCFMDFDT